MHHRPSKRYPTLRMYFGSSRRLMAQRAIILSFAVLTIFLSLSISVIMQAF